jgi:hypothetical protein
MAKIRRISDRPQNLFETNWLKNALLVMESLVAAPEHDQLLDRYRRAMAAYTGAVDAMEELEGQDRFRAQLQALEAHLACESAWNEVMQHQPERIR